jgi:cytochrome oxidase Cu insertion factor (SCO1/SenC/PrrC family)
MKIAVALFFSIGALSLASEQEKPPARDGVGPSIGLEIGQPAPAFALADQFGHKQSNESLKGSKGTVILFFRSADW